MTKPTPLSGTFRQIDRRSDNALRLAGFLPASRANGPGLRAVIWVQGCSLACPGCFNAHTHPARGGEVVALDDLFERITALPGLDGVTVSGGEPLQQRRPLLRLLTRLRGAGLPVILWTGYTWEEIQRMPDAGRLHTAVDVIIAGRYEQARRIAKTMQGSDNKTVHFLSGIYTMADFEAVPTGELIIAPDGTITRSGVDPLREEG